VGLSACGYQDLCYLSTACHRNLRTHQHSSHRPSDHSNNGNLKSNNSARLHSNSNSNRSSSNQSRLRIGRPKRIELPQLASIRVAYCQNYPVPRLGYRCCGVRLCPHRSRCLHSYNSWRVSGGPLSRKGKKGRAGGAFA